MRFIGMALAIGLLAAAARGQSSSLYLEDTPPTPAHRTIAGVPDRLSPALARTSLSAVRLPEPRTFAMHDLVTIIVRESTTTDSDASLDTEKKSKFDHKISAFPHLSLVDLLNFQLGQSGSDNLPAVGITANQKFEGDGQYSRRDSFTTRITARVIDVKPNGSLVLEARKFIKSDKESLNMVLTGTCRAQDIGADNSVLSTQLYDLNLTKEHTGELRKASKPGVLTRFFEVLFNF